METVFWERKPAQYPATKVVSFEEYCRQMETGEGQEMPSAFDRSVKRRGKRQSLELVCLLLEAGVCFSALILMGTTLVRLFTRG